MWTRCRRHARAGRPGRVSQHRHRGDHTSTGCCLISRVIRFARIATTLGSLSDKQENGFSLGERAHFPSRSPKNSFRLVYCFPGPLSLSLSAINVHFYCHLRNSAHYHNNNTERGGMRSPGTTDHESPTIRDGK